MRPLSFVFVSLAILAGAACSPQKESFDPADTLSFGTFDFVTSFSEERELTAPVDSFQPFVGRINGVIVRDNHLFLEHYTNSGKTINVYDPESFELNTQLVQIGNGPKEFNRYSWTPMFEALQRGTDGHLHYRRHDGKQSFLDIDFTNTLATGEDDITILRGDLDKGERPILLRDGRYFFKEYGGDEDAGVRFVKRSFENPDGTKETPRWLEPLDSPKVSLDPMASTGLCLSTNDLYNASKDRIVEICIGLNRINIYSPDGKFTKSLCIGGTPDKISEIAKIKKENEYSVAYATYGRALADDEWFAACIYAEDESRPEGWDIHVFDWNGKPLMNIHVPRMRDQFFALDVQRGRVIVPGREGYMLVYEADLSPLK